MYSQDLNSLLHIGLASNASISLVGTLSSSMALLIGPLAGLVSDHLEPSRTIMLACAFWVAGLIGAAFSNTVWQYLLTFGILCGLSCALAQVSLYFK